MDIRQLYFHSLAVKMYPEKKRVINHKYETRTKNSVMYETMSKTIGQRSHTFLAPKVYNFLPLNIKSITSINKYKKACKNFILTTDRKIINELIDLKNAINNI